MQTTRILQNKNLYCIFTKFIYKEKKKEQYTYKQQQQKRNIQTIQNKTKLTHPPPRSLV